MKVGITALITLFLFAINGVSQEISLKFAKTIGDHMVLQQGKTTQIWGTGTPGSEIELTFANKTTKSTVNKEGHWSQAVGPFETSNVGRALTVVSGEQTITVNDVLVGEVWMCSGQSNMQWRLEITENGKEEAATADFPNLRLFTTPQKTALTDQTDVSGGQWEKCTPASAAKFSAVGYYFGKELLNKLGDTPIGLIGTAWGGKPVEAFTSEAALESTPTAQALVAEWKKQDSDYDTEAAKAKYQKALAAYDISKKANAKLKKEGKKFKNVRKPNQPSQPLLNPSAPSSIYHQMISPWTPYAIRGAIWYQGESNQYRAHQYETIFPALISDWRNQWKNPDLPFYFVQLADFKTASTEPGTPSVWAELQNAQTLTLNKLPNTGMAIINDIGDAKDIHPRNKQDVGKRLSLWALAEDYGKELKAISGPIMASHKIDGDSIVVTFDHVGDGLKSKDGEPLKRFEIAGDNQQWIWANATISDDGKSVSVSHPDIEKPVAARYAWAANPEGANLVNSKDLPTSLFRTDSWPLYTENINTHSDSSRIRKAFDLKKKGVIALFNGVNTYGWMNPYNFGSVKVVDGEIHLEADKKFFLVTTDTYKDFELNVDIHLPEGKANSGVMFRCHVKPGKVYGYQAECDGSDRRWSGGLYDEGRRGWIWPSKKGKSKDKSFLSHEEESLAHMAKPEVAGALKRNDWNHYQITCKGNKILIKVNGVTITDFEDDTDSEGHIGIQHHGEKGAVYRFRNINLKPLAAEPKKTKALTTGESKNTKWVNLLESDSMDQWRAAKKDKDQNYPPIGKRWQLEDGVLSLERSREGTGKSIETKKNYHNFELKFDFNIKKGCNSGIKYRCKNSVGFEYQILDDVNHKDNKITHRTAEIYELAAEEIPRVLNPAGEWNSGRIVANGDTIEHWLNGQKVCAVKFGSEDWKKRFEKSKYFKKGTLDFGSHTGPIHIQDHSDTDLEIKNLLIREL